MSEKYLNERTSKFFSEFKAKFEKLNAEPVTETKITTDDSGLAAHRQGIETLRIGYNRYQIARRMTLRQWQNEWQQAAMTGKTIDEMIDMRIKNELDKKIS